MLVQNPAPAHLHRTASTETRFWPADAWLDVTPGGSSAPQTARPEPAARRKVSFALAPKTVDGDADGSSSPTQAALPSAPAAAQQEPCSPQKSSELHSDGEAAEGDVPTPVHGPLRVPTPPTDLQPPTANQPQPPLRQESLDCHPRSRWRRRPAPAAALVLVKRRWLLDLLNQVPSQHPGLEDAGLGATGTDEMADADVMVSQQDLDAALAALPDQTAARYRMMKEVLDTTAGFACMAQAAMDVDGRYTEHQVCSMLQRFQAEQEGSFRERPASRQARREDAGRRHFINNVLGAEALNAAATVIQRAYRRYKEQSRLLWKIATMKRGHMLERDWKFAHARTRPMRPRHEGQYSISPMLMRTGAQRDLAQEYFVQPVDGRPASRFRVDGTPGKAQHGLAAAPPAAASLRPMQSCPTPCSTPYTAPLNSRQPVLSQQLQPTPLPGFQAKYRFTPRYLNLQSSLRPQRQQERTLTAAAAQGPAMRRTASSLGSSSIRPSTVAHAAAASIVLPGSVNQASLFSRAGSTSIQEGGAAAAGAAVWRMGAEQAPLPHSSSITMSRKAQPWSAATDSVPLFAMDRSAGPASQLQYLWRQSSLSMEQHSVFALASGPPTQPPPGTVPDLPWVRARPSPIRENASSRQNGRFAISDSGAR